MCIARANHHNPKPQRGDMFIEYQSPNFPNSPKAPEGRHVCRVGRMHHKSRKTIPRTAILIGNLNKFGHF